MGVMLLLLAAGIFLAYTNGANDNFKGVATLYGSKTLSFKMALTWATVTTFAGSVASIFLAGKLVKAFSGKGLVPLEVAGMPEFLIAVGAGAAIAVLIATVTGYPISTTHSLTGALVGAGLVFAPKQLNLAMLGGKFFLPLLVSPLIALALAAAFYSIMRYIRIRFKVCKEWCVCTEEAEQTEPMPQPAARLASVWTPEPSSPPRLVIGPQSRCQTRYVGKLFGINLQRILDGLHVVSGGTVSFARGLNDTPKIVALLLIVQPLGLEWSMLLVAAGMAVGGMLQAKKVAHTVSDRITGMNHGQGFAANLVTGILVLFASRLGVPVSTTHVSVGSLFGIGAVSRRADTKMIGKVIASWVITLPAAAAAAALIALFIA